MYSGQVLRGSVGRPIPDLLETLRQEYETMGQEMSVFKAQRDDYERKRKPRPARAPPPAPPYPPHAPRRIAPHGCARRPPVGGVRPGFPAPAVAATCARHCDGAAAAGRRPRPRSGQRPRCLSVRPVRAGVRGGGRCGRLAESFPTRGAVLRGASGIGGSCGRAALCSRCECGDKRRLRGSGGAAARNECDERDS